MLSLETCRKLQDAGWPKSVSYGDSIAWCRREHEGTWEWGDVGTQLKHSYRYDQYIACPTLEELLEAIREMGDWIYPLLYYDRQRKQWNCATGLSGRGHYVDAQSPSEAAAALWLKLKGKDVA